MGHDGLHTYIRTKNIFINIILKAEMVNRPKNDKSNRDYDWKF